MTIRRAPTDGYDFSRKRDYRRKVWATARDGARRQGWVIAESHALLMPSIEGDEIETAVNAGFRESNLHIVDSNPAIVATLKRRWPSINTYGVSIERAFERISNSGVKLRFANLDLCGPMSIRLGQILCAIASTDCVTANGYIAISMLRGREDPRLTQFMSICSVISPLVWERAFGALSDFDARRLRFIELCLSLSGDGRMVKSLHPIRGEKYLSVSGQTMLWSVWQVRRLADVIECLEGIDGEITRISERLGNWKATSGDLTAAYQARDAEIRQLNVDILKDTERLMQIDCGVGRTVAAS